MSEPAELFAANLEAAFRVGERLVRSLHHLESVLPLTEGVSPEELGEEDILRIDAFLKRWENFQDILEGQVVRGMVILEGESDRVETRSDPKQVRRINGAAARARLLIETFNRIREHVRGKGLAPVAVESLPLPPAMDAS